MAFQYEKSAAPTARRVSTAAQVDISKSAAGTPEFLEKKKLKRLPAAPAKKAASGPTAYKGTRSVGTPGVVSDYYADMERYYAQAYQSQVDANNAAAQAAYDMADASAREQRSALELGYREANRQLYRDYMEARRELPQQMAAQGYGGGLSESSLVRLAGAYGDNLAASERARLASLADVEAALSRQQFETRAAADEANSRALQTYYTAVANLRSKQYTERRSDAKTRAGVLATAGDYSGYAALGFSKEDIAYLANMWRAKNPKLAPYQATGAARK